MKKSVATLLVSSHLAVLVAHGGVHSQLNIAVGTWQKLFIAMIIFVSPLIATMMLWTRMQELGVVLLGLSLAGSLVFGVSYHFLITGPDNVLGPYHSHWGTAFRTTAVLLALIEAAGSALCIFVLLNKPSAAVTSKMRSRRRQTHQSSPIRRTDSERPCS